MPSTVTSAPTFGVRIFMAGPALEAERICRTYCSAVGQCVTVTPTTYVYKFGQEAGFIVGLINYPRFPTTLEALETHAKTLAASLMEGLSQGSYTIETPDATTFYSRREDAPK